MTKKILSAFIISALCLAGKVYCRAETDFGKEEEYRISVNNLLDISVYGEPDLTKTVRVSPDGKITYPLLGTVSVAGLTAKELEDKLTELLERDYLVNPHVSVFIKEYAKVSVLGQVQKPGSYELKAGTAIMEAIALAAGFTATADPANVKLIRTVGGKKETITVDTKRITEEHDKKEDIVLKPNDIIVAEQFGMISVIGQVRKPGRFFLDRKITAIEAIALAGGFTDIASANATKVIRKREGKEEVFNVPADTILKGGDKSLDIVLEPDDTVVVPESFF
jgi:polysaccharide export outer membrane protein